MPKEGLYVTQFPELSQVWRPLHQYKWSVWESRDEIKYPHKPGFQKVLSNGQKFVVAQNGGTDLNRAEFVAPTLVTIQADTLPEAPDLLTGKIEIDFASGQTARVEDYFKDGYLLVNDHTGEGLILPVAGNDAITATSTTCTITLDGELFVELDTTTDVRLVSSPFRNMARGGTTSSLGGIPTDEVDEDDYFWLQVGGPTLATIGTGGCNAGDALTPAANGTLIEQGTTAGIPQVAYALETIAANAMGLVYLTG